MSLSTFLSSHLHESQFTQYNTGPSLSQSLLSVEAQAINNVLSIILSVCIYGVYDGVYVYTYLCMFRCMGMWSSGGGGQKSVLPAFLNSFLLFLETGSLSGLKLSDLVKLADQQASEILFSLLPQPWDYRQSTCLLTWVLEIESACTTHIFPAGTSPQTLVLSLFSLTLFH